MDAQELLFRNRIKFWRKRALEFRKVGSPHAACVLEDCCRDLEKDIEKLNAIRGLDTLKDELLAHPSSRDTEGSRAKSRRGTEGV